MLDRALLQTKESANIKETSFHSTVLEKNLLQTEESENIMGEMFIASFAASFHQEKLWHSAKQSIPSYQRVRKYEGVVFLLLSVPVLEKN